MLKTYTLPSVIGHTSNLTQLVHKSQHASFSSVLSIRCPSSCSMIKRSSSNSIIRHHRHTLRFRCRNALAQRDWFSSTTSNLKKKSTNSQLQQPRPIEWQLNETTLNREHKVFVIYPYSQREKTRFKTYHDMRLSEAASLAQTLGWNIMDQQSIALRRVDSRTLFGRGQLLALRTAMRESNARLLYIDSTEITTTQQRNIESFLSQDDSVVDATDDEALLQNNQLTDQTKHRRRKRQEINDKKYRVQVVDRFTVILQIFSQRANSREAQLQVSLARRMYEKGRLTHMFGNVGVGQHARGGFGFMGGPGETPLDIKRREVENSITTLRKQLTQVEKTRNLHRDSREKRAIPVVAVVGYTNAGKSALVNRLTGSALESSDLLFCSVDTYLRSFHLGKSGLRALISDTVGFVSDLPHQLVEAFKSTLEEVKTADLILHVRDISNPCHQEQNEQVHKVLSSLKVSDKLRDNMVEIWNKIDMLNNVQLEKIQEEADHNFNRTLLTSALHGTGVEKLRSVLEDVVLDAMGSHKYRLVFNSSTDSSQTMPWLHNNARVLSQRFTEKEGCLEVIVLMKDEVLEELKYSYQSRLDLKVELVQRTPALLR